MNCFEKIGVTVFLIILFYSNLIFAFSIEEREGAVTFISNQYVYVKFDDMTGIETGDTLFIRRGASIIAQLIVEHISSTSSACIRINNYEFKIDDKVIAKVKKQDEEQLEQKNIVEQPVAIPVTVPVSNNSSYRKPTLKSGISGRLSVQSHSNFSNSSTSVDYQRWRYTLSLYGDRIANSDLSFSSYINFNYRADNWSNVTSDIWQNLKIYDLALKYDFDNSFFIVAGRHRNRKISNIGSVDGIQSEKRFSNFYVGAVIGSRPEFADLSVNFKLFEYGSYVGRTDTINNSIMENNIAFMQQTNNFKTDRRFIYLQHSNNVLSNTSFFASSEIDLYKKIAGVESTVFTLTGLFLSINYSPIKLISASVSYDARKQVVYYETFKNFIDSLFENETRQGLNLRTNLRLFNNFFVGLNAGYRFMSKDIKPTKNFGGFISYSMIPLIETSLSLNYTKLITNFTNGSTAGISFSKNLFDNNIDISVGYRRSEYEFGRSNKLSQNSITVDLYGRISRHFALSVGYEGIFSEKNTAGRVLIDLTTRF